MKQSSPAQSRTIVSPFGVGGPVSLQPNSGQPEQIEGIVVLASILYPVSLHPKFFRV